MKQHSQRRRFRTLAAALAAGLFGTAWLVPQVTASAATFTTVSPPLTSAVDYLTGMASCGLGPIGLLPETASFLVSDYCNATTYRYDLTAGSPTLASSLQNGLTHALAKSNGIYYGVASSNQSVIPSGVWSFSPTSLKVTGQVIGNPCGGGDIRGLAAEPGGSDLFLTGDCGLFRITAPGSAVPSFTQIAAGNFDGITVDPASGHAWVADNGAGQIVEFDLSAKGRLRSFSGFPGPDGVAIAAPDAPADVAGDLFVNNNNGTISRVDLPSGTVTTVASGGSRGDFVAVGPDGFLYATQSDLVEQIKPAIFTQTTPGAGTTSTYVALGDSFASGEGADESQFYSGTTFPDPKVNGGTTGCHRARTSWGETVKAALLAAHKVDNAKFVACSGAVVDKLYSISSTYASVGEVEPPQLNTLTRNTTYATLSIGGNDAHFADLLQACVEVPPVRNGFGCRKSGREANRLAKDGLAQLTNGVRTPSLGPNATKTLGQVYLDIVDRMSSNGRLVVTGYPRLFADSRWGYDLGTACKVGTGTRFVGPHPVVLPVYISYDDAQWLNGLADSANTQLKRWATTANNALISAHRAARVEFAPISPAFDNHRLCSGSRWFNGIEFSGPFSGDALPKPKQVSFHPNNQGQKAYASVVVPMITK